MISLLNSKKCSTLKNLFALGSFLSLFSVSALAQTNAQIQKNLQQDLNRLRKTEFDSLLHKWQNEYGASAVSPLFQMAADRHIEDPKRYIALMGATKLSGKASRTIVEKFASDQSWMLRVASLRALTLLESKESIPVYLSALKDPALLVRSAAVEAIQTLKIQEAKAALTAALKSDENYNRAHQPLFICDQIKKALSAL